MEYQISKKLFETLTNEKIDNKWWKIYDNEISFSKFEDNISINDFFFKCIDFALENEFILISQFEPTQTVIEVFKEGKRVMFRGHINRQQAMFNTCQWILENKDKL